MATDDGGQVDGADRALEARGVGHRALRRPVQAEPPGGGPVPLQNGPRLPRRPRGAHRDEAVQDRRARHAVQRGQDTQGSGIRLRLLESHLALGAGLRRPAGEVLPASGRFPVRSEGHRSSRKQRGGQLDPPTHGGADDAQPLRGTRGHRPRRARPPVGSRGSDAHVQPLLQRRPPGGRGEVLFSSRLPQRRLAQREAHPLGCGRRVV
mmetsp:Transcript_22377/g.64190  ORF Transcript_22377/g.64190 Transcript_22377/m.64190 type:complete len:208 (-) Transcript_22377:2265-2888(-)